MCRSTPRYERTNFARFLYGKDVISWYTLILLSGCDIGGRGWILEGSTYSACKLMGSKWSAKTLLSTQAAHWTEAVSGFGVRVNKLVWWMMGLYWHCFTHIIFHPSNNIHGILYTWTRSRFWINGDNSFGPKHAWDCMLGLKIYKIDKQSCITGEATTVRMKNLEWGVDFFSLTNLVKTF